MVRSDPVVGVPGGLTTCSRQWLGIDSGPAQWARSVAITTGPPWELLADVHTFVAAVRSRPMDKNASITCPS